MKEWLGGTSLLKRFFMFRDRLLTWLFITASVVVDLALLAAEMASRDSFRFQALLQGIALGQVGALAIWTVTGRVHRLARGAGLIVATSLLALFAIHGEPWYFQEWLALLAIYAAIVMAAVALITIVRRIVSSKREQHETLQTPLIELFGWTIVVAIASFGARFMDFQVLERGLSKLPTTLTILAIPVIAEILHRPKFQPLHLLTWLVFVGAACALGYSLADRRFSPMLYATQAAYLAVWMIVRSLESNDPSIETAADSESKPVGSDSEPPSCDKTHLS